MSNNKSEQLHTIDSQRRERAREAARTEEYRLAEEHFAAIREQLERNVKIRQEAMQADALD